MTRDLEDYCTRVGIKGPLVPDLATVDRLVAAHIAAIPFENTGVHLDEPMTTSTEAAWEKIVHRRRGGWCYEMNAVFARVLEALGLPVTRHSCGVLRKIGSEEGMGGHLALTTMCEGQRLLVDVGFGSKLVAPLPLREGTRYDAPFTVGLSRTSDGYWRFQEVGSDAKPIWFDFLDLPADENQLSERCSWQACNPESVFRRKLTAQIRRGDTHFALRNSELTISAVGGVEVRKLDSEDDCRALLSDTFGLPAELVNRLQMPA